MNDVQMVIDFLKRSKATVFVNTVQSLSDQNTTLSARVAELEAERIALRKVISDTASAIGNGATISENSTLQFIEGLPTEVRLHCVRLRADAYQADEECKEATQRADALQRVIDEARGQEPVAWETRWAGKGGPYAWGSGFLHKDHPDRIADGVEIRPLYAAPVPAQPSAVADICNAYESGVGHRGRKTAKVNPYKSGTPEHEAYAIGAEGEQPSAHVAQPRMWQDTERTIPAAKDGDPVAVVEPGIRVVRDELTDDDRAAIVRDLMPLAEKPAPAVADGYVLVPVKATKAMWLAGAEHTNGPLDDGSECDKHTAIGRALCCYDAMLAASAPKEGK